MLLLIGWPTFIMRKGTLVMQDRIIKAIKRRNILIIMIFLYIIPLCAWSLTPYSTRELEELEKEFIQQINQSDSVERNPLANQYINHLGKRLSRFIKIPTPGFFIVKSNEINAFAGPGGFIGINSQLILSSRTESELAAVMAHELAHVRLHHIYSMIEHQKQMQIPMLASLLASVALGVINPTLGSGAMMASMTGFAQDNINFTRAKEKEADRIGIDMLIRADFNPRAMADFFKKMQETSRYYYTANTPAILRTHPLDEDRIAEADNRSLHLPKKPYPDSQDYGLFKELIRVTTAADPKQLLEYYHHNCHQGTSCQYGQAMAYLSLHQFSQAQSRLNGLLDKEKNNLFFQIAMAEAEIGNKQFEPAIKRLRDLQSNFPENYATLMAYARGLLATGQAEKAASVLLRGRRLFNSNLPLCEELAQAQAEAHLKAYAYFTKSQCQLLQGRKREAMRDLKLVKSLAKNDKYLLARTEAMIEEIKYLNEP